MSNRAMAMSRMSLLSFVADEFGFDTVEDMLASAVCDGVCPAVCPHCHNTMELEPDGYCECEECGGKMRSVLLIAGMI